MATSSARAHDRIPGTLIALVIVGGLATLCGLATCIDYADHLQRLAEPAHPGDAMSNPSGSVVADVGGRALLVVAQTVACLLFTVFAALAIGVRAQRFDAAIALSSAIAATLWLLWSVGAHWNPGWYHVLDPVRRGFALPFAATSVLQALLWIGAAFQLRSEANASTPA
jgi:hypothetical protein